MNRTFGVCSWNVRGLGDPDKCSDVLMKLLSSNHDIVLLQETKLPHIPPLKLVSFLPRRLNSFHFSPSDGASGGILTAWVDTHFTSLNTFTTAHTLSVFLSSSITNFSFLVTNIYAPSTPELRPDFLAELKTIAPPASVPWIFSGDFNMIRYAHEKNNNNFRLAEAEYFNDCINDMCLIELPLLDRNFTWSNRRASPTLERLDRVFINLRWDELLPNTTLSSLTRATSDHVPLRIDISTTIPNSHVFHFENYWVHSPGFFETMASAWTCRTGNSNAAAAIAANLKAVRPALKKLEKNILTYITAGD